MAQSYTFTSSSFTPSPHVTTQTAPRRRGRPPSSITKAKTSKKQKITEQQRQLPEKLYTFVPETEIYSQLLDFERKLDATLQRKHLDLQEAKQLSPPRTIRTLRMFIYNTYENQTAFYHTDSSYRVSMAEPPSWTLKIEGYLLDQENTRQARAPKKKFSRFFRKIFIQLDKDVYKDNNTVEWDKTQASGDTDGFEIKRIGSKEIKVKIFLHLDFYPTRYKLSMPLASLLGIHTETRPKIITALWQYIKLHKLQDVDEDRRQVLCDPALKEIFGCDKLEFSAIPSMIGEHLGPPDPIELEYTIQLSGNHMDYRECYDIQIDLDDQAAKMPLSYKMKELEHLDEQIVSAVQQIKEHTKKREFMLRFSEEPVKFLDQLIASQIHDYQLLQSDGAASASFEEERHAGFYYQPNTVSAIKRYLNEGQD